MSKLSGDEILEKQSILLNPRDLTRHQMIERCLRGKLFCFSDFTNNPVTVLNGLHRH